MNVLIFPHQLYQHHPLLQDSSVEQVILIEDSLFFGDRVYPAKFHKQKLWLHRASMKRFEQTLQDRGRKPIYLEYATKRQGKRQSLEDLIASCIDRRRKKHQFACLDPVDFVLEKRLHRAASNLGVELRFVDTPGFLNTKKQNQTYRSTKNRWFMADFYKWQRKRLDILMEGDEPTGGRWSFDDENRKKVPKKLLSRTPQLDFPPHDSIDSEAREYVESNFAENPGALDSLYYPTSWEQAQAWLQQFLERRFERFGDFEDAIVEGKSWLWHSVLTPALNIGLLTPEQVLQECLTAIGQHDVPINSAEGFVRQVIGWREFIRATYEDLGVSMRTTNHWQHTRNMPSGFYNATTGILPIDDTIERVLDTGYCHHIERLMVLGGFMFLCELDPQQIYQWFMEMFVDSYDWVMVPNVYGMSQHADGGQITTKPYFSGSAYIRKMSHYPKGEWCDIWDGLYWRWILKHMNALEKNPRWSMMCSMARKMDEDKKKSHLRIAEGFLSKLTTDS